MEEFFLNHWLDIVTTILGLIYLVLEYRASIALWVVGIVMPAMDIYLYWSHGLYGDAGMAVYYTLAAIYGYAVWKFGAKWKRMLKRKASGVAGSDKAVDAAGGSSEELPITFFPRHLILRTLGFFLLAWAATYYVLVAYTNSTVPFWDAATTAASIVAMWMLSRKYVEQWLVWLAVDLVTVGLYLYKGIPLTAGLYALYSALAVAGYLRWKAKMRA